jgi:putative tryptophan/tyrosine transport system substrate-binding protein
LRTGPSLSRPDGNVTGATSYVAQLASRQLEALHELVPTAATVGVFINPHARANAEPQVRDLRNAANALDLRLHVIEVGGEGDLTAAFASLVGAGADALFVTADGFLHNQQRDPIIALAVQHRLPAMYVYRDCVEAGGLICYTSSVLDALRQAGFCPPWRRSRAARTRFTSVSTRSSTATGLWPPPPPRGVSGETEFHSRSNVTSRICP